MAEPGEDIRVGFLGFGEAARAIRSGWGAHLPARIAAYDIKTDSPGDAREEMRAAYRDANLEGCDGPADLAAASDVIFSLVTADRAHAAARAVAPHLRPGTLVLDGNSCAPQTKQDSAQVIAAAGGRYVDLAIMAPIHPRLHRTPMLIGGPETGAALDALDRLDMTAEIAGESVGAAAAVKLVRSIMVKGLEALLAECVLTGRELGVEEAVLASLEQSYPGFGFEDRAAYAFDRMIVHGSRRAAEMRETAEMVARAGLPGGMAAASANWQDAIGALGLDPGDDDLRARADRLRAALAATETDTEEGDST